MTRFSFTNGRRVNRLENCNNKKDTNNERFIGQVSRVLAGDPEDLGSIPGRVISKTLKMVLGTSLLNTQQYKVRIENKVEQSRERSSTLPYTPV